MQRPRDRQPNSLHRSSCRGGTKGEKGRERREERGGEGENVPLDPSPFPSFPHLSPFSLPVGRSSDGRSPESESGLTLAAAARHQQPSGQGDNERE